MPFCYTRQDLPYNGLQLIGYTNVDWGYTSGSPRGVCFFMNNSLISRYSKKQLWVVVSTFKAKYVVVSMACW